MDILALAELPLATLAFAAALWVVSRFWETASLRRDAARERYALHNQLVHHASYNYGTMLYFFDAIHARLGRAADLIDAGAGAAEPGQSAPPPGTMVQGFLKRLNARAPAREAEPSQLAMEILRADDFTSTTGFLDAETVSENLHRLEADVAGMALILIEERPMIFALAEQANAANDTPEGAKDYLRKLVSLQFCCVIAAIAARGVTDAAFRTDLCAAIHGKTDEEAAKALFAMVKRKIPQIRDLYVCYDDPAAQDGCVVQTLEINAHTASCLEVPKFRLLEMDTKSLTPLDYRVLPALATGALALLMLLPGIGALIAPADPVSCTATLDPDGVTGAECVVSGSDLAVTLDQIGLAGILPDPEPQPPATSPER